LLLIKEQMKLDYSWMDKVAETSPIRGHIQLALATNETLKERYLKAFSNVNQT
jgi:hypothetical protein